MGAPLSGNAKLFHPRHLHMTEKRAALPSPPPPHGDRGHIDAHMDIVHGAAGWDARGGMGVARCTPPSLVTPPRPEPRGAFFAPLGRGAAQTSPKLLKLHHTEAKPAHKPRSLPLQRCRNLERFAISARAHSIVALPGSRAGRWRFADVSQRNLLQEPTTHGPCRKRCRKWILDPPYGRVR